MGVTLRGYACTASVVLQKHSRVKSVLLGVLFVAITSINGSGSYLYVTRMLVVHVASMNFMHVWQ